MAIDDHSDNAGIPDRAQRDGYTGEFRRRAWRGAREFAVFGVVGGLAYVCGQEHLDTSGKVAAGLLGAGVGGFYSWYVLAGWREMKAKQRRDQYSGRVSDE